MDRKLKLFHVQHGAIRHRHKCLKGWASQIIIVFLGQVWKYQSSIDIIKAIIFTCGSKSGPSQNIYVPIFGLNPCPASSCFRDDLQIIKYTSRWWMYLHSFSVSNLVTIPLVHSLIIKSFLYRAHNTTLKNKKHTPKDSSFTAKCRGTKLTVA